MNAPDCLQTKAQAPPETGKAPAADVVLLFPAESAARPAVAGGKVSRLLRHRFTRKYFIQGGWTENPDDAQVFFDALEAAQTCAQYRLTDMELALRVRSGTCDIFSTRIR